MNELAGVYKTESLAEFLSLPYERFGSLKERNDQCCGDKEADRPLCELLRTRLEISCPPDPAVPSELSPECPPQTRRGTSAPASWVSPVSPPSARTVRCRPVDYGEFLISSAINRSYLGSGGWWHVRFTSLTGGIEAQSDRKVSNLSMETALVTCCLDKCFSS